MKLAIVFAIGGASIMHCRSPLEIGSFSTTRISCASNLLTVHKYYRPLWGPPTSSGDLPRGHSFHISRRWYLLRLRLYLWLVVLGGFINRAMMVPGSNPGELLGRVNVPRSGIEGELPLEPEWWPPEIISRVTGEFEWFSNYFGLDCRSRYRMKTKWDCDNWNDGIWYLIFSYI